MTHFCVFFKHLFFLCTWCTLVLMSLYVYLYSTPLEKWFKCECADWQMDATKCIIYPACFSVNNQVILLTTLQVHLSPCILWDAKYMHLIARHNFIICFRDMWETHLNYWKWLIFYHPAWECNHWIYWTRNMTLPFTAHW